MLCGFFILKVLWLCDMLCISCQLAKTRRPNKQVSYIGIGAESVNGSVSRHGGRGCGVPEVGAAARPSGRRAIGPPRPTNPGCGRKQDEAGLRPPRGLRFRPPLLRRELRPGTRREGSPGFVKLLQLPDDIEWHFIGNLQSNKVKSLLAGVPNLAYVETVDDEKIANHLDRAIANIGRKPLKVFVQVNTSGEISKSGVEPAQCVDLVKHVRNCPNLEFCGLMTIGMLDYTSTPENFKTLSNCRSEVCKELGISEEQCELSMGMSGDFELAIEMGSTNVRIGSTIFGAREYPKKEKK